MSANTVAAFDSTLHKTNTWLKEVMEQLDWQDYQRAYRALRAVLHALRDRLTIEEATDLGAQLPMLVRGIYYEGWNPTHTPITDRKRDKFLRDVADEFGGDVIADAEQITCAVFKVLEKHVTEGEINDVRQALPAAIRRLWT